MVVDKAERCGSLKGRHEVDDVEGSRSVGEVDAWKAAAAVAGTVGGKGHSANDRFGQVKRAHCCQNP